jgi:DHA2 family multidrug resistance protein-like MFS transporter
MTQTLRAGPRAGAREWAALAVLALPCLLVSMDANVLGLAIPSLTADLRPTNTQLLWIVDSYAFLVAGSLLTMGAIGDRVGRRRLLLVGAAAFGLASLLAAFSTSAMMLIAARGLLGVAGATLMPSTLSLIRSMFSDPRQRTTAFSVWTASFALGGVIAPVVAGILLRHFWWGSVFLVAVPVMLLLLVLGPVLLPEFRSEEAVRVDLSSAGLSLVAVLSVTFGLKRAVQNGLDVAAAVSIVTGLAVAVVFVRRQQERSDPLLDLTLFRRHSFTVPLVINAMSFFVLYGTQLFIAQYLQLVLGLSALAAGLWSIPGALGYLLGSAVGPVVARRLGASGALCASLVLSAAGVALLTQVGRGDLAAVVTGSVVLAVGLAPVYIVATDLVVAAAPPERTGSASAILETFAELGGALGIAVLGSIGGTVYRHAIPTAPQGIPRGLWENVRGTLGGAVAVTDRLPGPVAAELLRTARAAFLQAFLVVEVLGMTVMVALAFVALLLGRSAVAHQDRAGHPTSHHD